MEWKLEGTSISHPSELGQFLRELAPDLCSKFDTLAKFQEYVWDDSNLMEIRVHPRQEMFARLCCDPPPGLMGGGAIKSPSFCLHIDYTMPEYEMYLVYKNGEKKTIKLDSWWNEKIKELPESVQKTFPFLIVPKASKSEKNKGLDGMPDMETRRYGDRGQGNLPKQTPQKTIIDKNNHPTVKPLKLMSYLITLGSREGDTILDPFLGSGTTALASQMLNRKCIGIENDEENCKIAKARCSQVRQQVWESFL